MNRCRFTENDRGAECPECGYIEPDVHDGEKLDCPHCGSPLEVEIEDGVFTTFLGEFNPA